MMTASNEVLVVGGILAWKTLDIIRDVLRRTRKKEEKEEPKGPFCGCTHHYSFHDPKTGACLFVKTLTETRKEPVRQNGVVVRSNWGEVEYIKQTVIVGSEPCTCPRYTGPEPLPSLYAEDLVPLDRDGER